MMGPTHSYESFNANTHQEVDADAEGNSATERLILCQCTGVEADFSLPVEGIVDVGKYMEEMNRIKLSETISDRVHAGKYQVEAATRQNKTSWLPFFLLGSKIQEGKKLMMTGGARGSTE